MFVTDLLASDEASMILKRREVVPRGSPLKTTQTCHDKLFYVIAFFFITFVLLRCFAAASRPTGTSEATIPTTTAPMVFTRGDEPNVGGGVATVVVVQVVDAAGQWKQSESARTIVDTEAPLAGGAVRSMP